MAAQLPTNYYVMYALRRVREQKGKRWVDIVHRRKKREVAEGEASRPAADRPSHAARHCAGAGAGAGTGSGWYCAAAATAADTLPRYGWCRLCLSGPTTGSPLDIRRGVMAEVLWRSLTRGLSH